MPQTFCDRKPQFHTHMNEHFSYLSALTVLREYSTTYQIIKLRWIRLFLVTTQITRKSMKLNKLSANSFNSEKFC